MEGQETRVVHLKREKGKIVEDCDVYIGRQWKKGGWDLEESKWHNPYQIKRGYCDRDQCLEKYKNYVSQNETLMSELHELKGKR